MHRSRSASPLALLALLVAAVTLSLRASARAAETPREGAQEQELDALRAELAASDARARQRAVGGLAELGGEAAWSLVLGALADPDARVADEAQLRLGALPAELGVGLLLGKDGLGARRPGVAARAAEALGRLAFPVSHGPIVPALAGDDPEVRGMLLWSLERLARAGRLTGDLQGDAWRRVDRVFARDRDPELRAQALQTLVAFSPARAADAIRDAAQAKEPALRRSAVEAALALPPPGPASLYVALAEDPAWPVRARVVDVLASLRNATGALALADRLAAESEERVAWHIVARLQALSGLKHGRDPRPWRDWAAGLAPDWTPAAAAPGDERLGDATVSFAGMPVLSRRVAFLIDMSGSMWQERDGGTRKQAVDAELRRLLESLPPDTRFNVIPYADRPAPWEKQLVSASRGNVKKAIADFEASRLSGKGAFWEAFQLALEDPDVDTVMVLTDGAPTGGARWNLELLAELLPQRDRYRGVALDAILFDARGRLVGHWERMCAATGGRTRVVDL